MKFRNLSLYALTLSLLWVFGCESPVSTDLSISKPSKPPGGGGGEREIVFVENVRRAGDCIRAMSSDGSSIVTVQCPESGSPPLAEPSWSPDGTAVAYRDVGGNGIYRVDISADGSGTNEQLLLSAADCGGFCAGPEWSPQGHEIAVQGSGGQLLLVPASGCPSPPAGPCPGVFTIEVEPGGGIAGVTWNPDGTQLALTVNRAIGSSSILILNRGDGSVAAEYPFFPGSALDWGRGSQANTLVISVWNDANDLDLFLFDLTTGQSSFLAESARHPTFSPDGAFIAFRNNSGSGRNLGIMKLHLATGERTLLRSEGGWPDWK